MKKALLITTVSGFVPQFEMNSVRLLQENGYEVHYATNYNNVFYGKDNSRLDGTGIIRHQVDFARSPYSKQIITAYRQLDKLMSEIKFDVIHCHTPIGSVLGRILGHKHKVSKVVYTAHGFHFYKGAPVINKILYYSIEKAMARYTDVLITINREDFLNANKFTTKKKGNVYYIAGAGIDTGKFKDVDIDRKEKRRELGMEEDDFIIISVGELNKNKNHSAVIKALKGIKDKKIKYLICGEGVYRSELTDIIKKLNMEDRVKLLGYRTDIPELEAAADLFAFPSYREGLPVAMMEAMSCGLPVIASKIRGNVDLVEDGINGYLASPDNYIQWKEKIVYMYKNRNMLNTISYNNTDKMEKYDKEEIKKQLYTIYKENNII